MVAFFSSFFTDSFVSSNYLTVDHFFMEKLKKKLDMPHGGMVGFSSARKIVSYTLNASPLQGGSYPHEPLFFYQ
jgi:hypothetical protein